MSGKNINFNGNEIRKSYFYENKKINKIVEIDTNKILVSKKESYSTKSSFKFFIGYNDNDVIKPLCIRLPQMTGFVRIFEKVEKLMKIDFGSKPVYDDD